MILFVLVQCTVLAIDFLNTDFLPSWGSQIWFGCAIENSHVQFFLEKRGPFIPITTFFGQVNGICQNPRKHP